MTVINVLNTGTQAQLGSLQARFESSLVAFGRLAIDEQAETLFKGQGFDVRHVHLLHEGLIHAREFEGLQFV
jgi:hypothetical protein